MKQLFLLLLLSLNCFGAGFETSQPWVETAIDISHTRTNVATSFSTWANPNSGLIGWHINKSTNSNNPHGISWDIGGVSKWEIGMDYQNEDMVLLYNPGFGDQVRAGYGGRLNIGPNIGSPSGNDTQVYIRGRLSTETNTLAASPLALASGAAGSPNLKLLQSQANSVNTSITFANGQWMIGTATGGGSAHDFYIYDISSSKIVYYASPTDQVGIGTTSPTDTLSVGGGITSDTLSTTNTITTSNLTVNGVLKVAVPATTQAPALTSPVGYFGVLSQINSSNSVTLSGTHYTNIVSFSTHITNGFNVNLSGGFLTNLVAGYYDISLNISDTGAANQMIEGCVLTNMVDSELIGFKKQFSNTQPRQANGSARSIMYLPANTGISFGLKSTNDTTALSIHKANLTVKGL